MNIDFPYIKERSEFGSYCYFLNDGPYIEDSILPDKTLSDLYITKTPVNKETQESAVMSLNEVNTWRADYSDRGMFHDQGGWPKDLNITDEEAVLRFRKKLEREDNYIASMKCLSKPIEHAILQNNAVNIYELYFDDVIKEYSTVQSLTQIRNIYRDPKFSEVSRSVNSLSWSPGSASFAASYGNTNFSLWNKQESTEAYVWNVEIPGVPEIVFDSKITIVRLEWNALDHNILAGGLENGQIAIYDIRKPPGHTEITPDVSSHRDPVHSLLWINSKTGTEFFSTSSDGVVKWWDMRRMNKFTDSIILDISKSQNILRAYGASALEFDSSIPAKYLVGTETGHVICGNRKGATLSEKLPWVMKTHEGPVRSVMRNPAFTKMFLTAGEWNVRIWSEECKESAVMWIKSYEAKVTCSEWSKSRYSVFCLTRTDGFLDVWDILINQRAPHASVKVSKDGLTKIRIDDQGQYLVVGDETGKCFLIQLGESLSTCAKNDKVYLGAMFDRENRREKILEGRNREIRLALKLKAQQAEETKEAASSDELSGKVQEVFVAEADYWEEVERVQNAYSESYKKREGREEKEEDFVPPEEMFIPIKEEVPKEEPSEPTEPPPAP